MQFVPCRFNPLNPWPDIGNSHGLFGFLDIEFLVRAFSNRLCPEIDLIEFHMLNCEMVGKLGE
jgi:hypothetical protein